MLTVPYAETAAELLAYFRRFEQVHGDRFTPGRRAAQAWADLLARGEWSADDLAGVDDAMRRATVMTGSVAFELRMQYRAWRREVTGDSGPADPS